MTVALVSLLLAALLLGGRAEPHSPDLNVVFILIDDLGWRDLGCQGSRYYRTPHIDRLAAEGMRFTNGYAAGNVCSPSRAAIMTGSTRPG
jgi:arylsulfatase A-like enzyme